MSGSQGVLKNLFWSFSERVGAQMISLLVSIILARMILPEEYGVIAAVNIFTSLATCFVGGGFGSALIQKKDADDKDFSTLFLFNTFFSIAMYGIVYITAPFLVKFLNDSFDRELLVDVLRVLGIGIVLASFNSFYRSVLTKKLLFKKIFTVTLIGLILSALIGIFMAYNGFGVWALVFQNLVSYGINTLFFMFSSNWKPKLYFSFKRFKPLFLFGFKLMLVNFIATIYTDITSMVIGNRHSAKELAYYKKGIDFPKVIVLNLVAAVDAVLFPTMSKINDKKMIKEIVCRFNRISVFIISPLMLGFAAISPKFIELVLTENWLPCVPFLQISCLTYSFLPIGRANIQYLKAAGNANLYLLLDVFRRAFSIFLLFLATVGQKNIILIALSETVANLIAVFINMYPGKKCLGYTVTEQIKDILPKYLLSLFMFFVVYFINLIDVPLIIGLFLQIISGILVYLLMAKIFKMKELNEVFSLIKNLISGKYA